jgi:cytidylate kinase
VNQAQTVYTITLDGPAGVGKSTLAARVAEELGIACLDTGAMFRVVALHLAASPGGLPGEETERARRLEECSFSLRGVGRATRLLCNGTHVGEEIRSEEAGMLAARVALLPVVRDFLKRAQQGLGEEFCLVAEGRDMGTVVFPNALCKIYLEADPEIRAARRCAQLRQQGLPCDMDTLAEQIRLRDAQDRERAIAPLRPAADAHRIDTSHKDIDAVFAEIMRAVAASREKSLPSRPPRRKDRSISLPESLALLERGEYGVLALVDGGSPYAVPLSYALMDGALYFHCAREGRKVDAMQAAPEVCLTVVGDTEPVYQADFSTYYESVMVFGRVSPVDEGEEKHRALLALARKYLPDHMDKAEDAIRHSNKRTAVYRISLNRVTGKAKRKKASGM